MTLKDNYINRMIQWSQKWRNVLNSLKSIQEITFHSFYNTWYKWPSAHLRGHPNEDGAKTVPTKLDEMPRLAKHPLSSGKDHRILSVPPGESNPSSHWLLTSGLQTENISFVVLSHQICDTYHPRPRKRAYDYECVKYFSYSFSLLNINFLRYYRKIPYLFHSCKRVKEHRGSRKKARKIRGKKSIIA